MAKDYFQTDEFNELLEMYERQKKKRKSIYLDAEEFADIADYYLGNDSPVAAMESVDMGLSIHQGSDVLLMMKSAIYIYQFNFKEAEAILIGLDESNPEVLYQLAQLQYAYHLNTPKAEKMWREWLRMENEGDDVDDEYRRENYIHIISTIVVLRTPNAALDEQEQTVNILRRWVREYIDTFQPLGKFDFDVQLVDICRENDMVDLLCESLSQVLEEQPYLPKGWSTLALGYYVQMEYKQALEACTFALAIDPNDLDALLTNAYTLYDMNDRQGAKPIFKMYIDKGGDPVQILPYAEMLFLDGERKEALTRLKFLIRHLENKKKELEKQKKEIIVDDQSVEYKDVCKAYEDFMDLYKKTLNDIGDICYRNECYKESFRAYTCLADAGYDSYETYFMIGLNHLAMEHFQEAVYSFGLALAGAEDRVVTGIDIAMAFIINNYEEFALQVFETIDSLSEKEYSPYAKNIAAAKSLAYLKLGDTEQFFTFFKIACEDTPELIQKFYDEYFPTDMPVSEWYDYAQREIQTLLKKINKEDVHIAGF